MKMFALTDWIKYGMVDDMPSLALYQDRDNVAWQSCLFIDIVTDLNFLAHTAAIRKIINYITEVIHFRPSED